MTYTKKERENYNIDRELTCKKLNINKNQYNWFRRKGEVLHKIFEDYCNGIEKQYNDKLLVDTKSIVESKASKLGLNVYYQTDPRGATLYLDKKPLNQSNYTRGGCIY